MQFTMPSVLNEMLDLSYWRSQYNDKHQAKVAFKIAKKIYIRTRLAEAQNWRCCWCGCVCTEERGRSNSTSIEHVTPQSIGGADLWENYAMSCNRCNGARGTREVDQFFEMVKKGNFKQERTTVSNSQRRREKKNNDRTRQKEVLLALKNNAENPFTEGSKEYKMFDRYKKSEFFTND